MLTAHSLLRWVAVIAGLIAVARAFSGRQRQRPWSAADNRIGLFFTITLDLQLLIGLLLYLWLSPLTRIALDDFGGAMRNPGLRFWVAEHPFGMLVALILAHVGRVRIRKASGNDRRHALAATFFSLAMLVLLLSLPWPGLPYGRPLLRW